MQLLIKMQVEDFIFSEVCLVISGKYSWEKFGDQYPLPKEEMPKWLFGCCPILDKTLSRKYIQEIWGILGEEIIQKHQ